MAQARAGRHKASLVRGSRFMHDVMLAKDFDVVFRGYPCGHNWFIWGEELDPALNHLLG